MSATKDEDGNHTVGGDLGGGGIKGGLRSEVVEEMVVEE